MTSDNTEQQPTASPPGLSPHSAAPLFNETNKSAANAGTHSSLLDKGKRKLLGLGRKKDADKSDKKMTTSVPTLASPPLSPLFADGRSSPRDSPRMQSAGVAQSPTRRIHRSSSPGLLHSPASSQIFERNVQDSVTELDRSELSPHLPTHIQTEDHIPPVLEASSWAITDDQLNPDEVEIVMHAAHQPASAAVAGSRESVYNPSQDELPASPAASGHVEGNDGTSNYGSIDTTDVRRLSFISFADVVQAEHVENDRDAVQFMGLSSTANRSPSPPVRSPASSHGFSISPLTSGATSEKGSLRGVRTPGSPMATTHPLGGTGTYSPPLGGDLQIETMRQALRKTGSDELAGGRSQPLSAVSLEDNMADQPPFK